MHDRPAPTTVSRPRRFGPALGAVLAVAAIFAAAFVIAKGRDVGLARPDVGDVLLAASADGTAGTSLRLRVRKPSRLSFAVTTSAPVRVVFGVPRPPERGPEDLPAETGSVTWTVAPGQAPHEEIVLAAGMYVVRVEGAASGPAPAGPVGVRVTALPP